MLVTPADHRRAWPHKKGDEALFVKELKTYLETTIRSATGKYVRVADMARLDPHFAYKAVNNTDTLDIKQYIIRTLCIQSSK